MLLDNEPIRKAPMIKKILLVLIIFIVVFIVIVALQPAEYSIVRTTTISAPAKAVFGEVNDFHKWEAWSPWAKLDPDVKNAFEGAPAGEGAVFTWAGNSKVGAGRMKITESKPDYLIRIKLDILKLFSSTANVEFVF